MIVRLRRTWSRPLGRCILAVLPPFNFLTLHYAYFIATPLICSVIFWGSATPSRSVHYADALFMCVSAMTGAGLNTVDLSSLNTFQQSIIFALLILGHAILISITVLFVRKRAFQLKFKTISESSAARNLFGQSSLGFLKPAGKTKIHTSQPGAPHSPEGAQGAAAENTPLESSNVVDDDHIRWGDDDQITIGHVEPRHHHHHRVFPMAGVGARLDLNNHPRDVAPTVPLDGAPDEIPRLKGILRDTQRYFASKGFISRNSQFHGLTLEEREELGGVEYKAVSFLSVIVLIYWATFLIIGIVGVGGWLEANHPEIPRANGLSPFWTGTFFAVSAFVNSGMSLLDANKVSYFSLTLEDIAD
jgi:hypothetical protein